MSLLESKKVPLEKLRKKTDAAALGFATTDELMCNEQLIGQKRAVNAISYALEVDQKGYNLFVVGDPGSGRTTYTLRQMNERASAMPAPDDWIYAYNFDEPGEPLAISLPAGCGKKLASAMDDLVEDLKTNLGKAFDNSEYEDNKASLVKAFQENVGELMDSLRAYALEKNFSIKRTPQGFVNLPLIKEEAPKSEEADSEEEDGGEGEQSEPVLVTREMQPEEFEHLPEAEQGEIQKKSDDIAAHTLEILRTMREREKDLKEKIKELDGEICRTAIQPILSELREKFPDNGKLSDWMDKLADDIIENYGMFVAAARDENADIDFSRFTVNVFVSNDPEHGAPVIRETNPTYYNLVGKIEYESRQGYLYTD
ncbi:MAG: AAA family ATPase, partial [Synergistaceae bacterium]|nr:AAA family ATPase [Synergistaceae bacterium]